MDETTPFTPQAWESFYVIVGSSAGALTGLQFVVLTLITEAGMVPGSGETLSAFGSPNVLHFCAALLVSAIFSAPWHDLGPPGIAVAVAGACGFVSWRGKDEGSGPAFVSDFISFLEGSFKCPIGTMQ